MAAICGTIATVIAEAPVAERTSFFHAAFAPSFDATQQLASVDADRPVEGVLPSAIRWKPTYQNDMDGGPAVMRGNSNVEAVHRCAQINVGNHRIGTICLRWIQ